MDRNFLQTPLTGTEADFPLLASIGQGKLSLPESGIETLVSSVALVALDRILRKSELYFQGDRSDILKGIEAVKNEKEAKSTDVNYILRENKRIGSELKQIVLELYELKGETKLALIPLCDSLLNYESKNPVELKEQSQKFRSEIVKALVPHALFTIKDLVPRFGIENQEAVFIEIAKAIAILDLNWVFKYIKESRITDQRGLIEIAKVAAEKFPDTTARKIEEFGIADQIGLIEIAKICLNHGDNDVVNYIPKFGIQDEDARIEIVELCAVPSPGHVARNIRNFGIVNQAALIRLAKLCIRSRVFAECFKDFGITDPEARVEIAEISIVTAPHETCASIKDFGITDPATLIRLAKMGAKVSGRIVSYIPVFGITDREALLEILELCVVRAPFATCASIKDFGIIDRTTILRLVKMGAKVSGEIVELFKDLGIEDEKTRIEIVELCIESDPVVTARNMIFSGITDQAALIKLAMRGAELSGEIAENIQNFGIEDEGARVKIAKLCAMQGGMITATWIKKFNIEEEGARFEVAKLCAEQDGEMAEYIDNFGLTDPMPILILAVKCHPECVTSLKDYPNFTIARELHRAQKPLVKLEDMIIKKIRGPLGDNLTDALQAIVRLMTIDENAFSHLPEAERNEKIREAYARREEQNNLLISLVWMMEQRISIGKWAEVLSLFPLIANYLMPSLKWRFLLQIIELAASENFPTFPSGDKGWLTLQKVLSEGLLRKGVSREKIERILSRVEDSKAFRDGKNQRGLHEAMLCLIEEERIDTAAIERLLDKVIETLPKEVQGNLTRNEALKLGKKVTEFLQQIKLLPSFLCLATPQLLVEKSDKKISELLEIAFKKAFPLGTIADFGKKYAKMMEEARIPSAFLQYYGKLKRLNDVAITRDLAAILTAILEGQWNTVRNSSLANPHLKKIAEKHASIVAKWFLPCETFSLALLEKPKAETTFSYGAWLKQQLIDDGHLGDLALKNPLLYRYLSVPEGDEKENLRLEIRSLGQKNLLANRIISLLLAQNGAAEIVAIKELLELSDVKTSEFQHHLSGRLKLLQGGRKSVSDAFVVDTEDWNDILLCGVEIAGSCQRIDGDPQLNKGLLGYLLDGKIRMIAIKDKEGPEGRLMARALIKLLWDGEKPVLFLERIYDNTNSALHRAALIKVAKQKAVELGIPLVSLEGSGAPYEKPLQSLGGPASFEYSDGSGGVKKHGVYSISGAKIVDS